MEKIKGIKGLTEFEREFLIQDVMQMNDEEAKRWINKFEKSLSN
jgi:hypothetical protein